MQCFTCQKFRPNKELCRGRQVCGKWRERDADHMENECKNIKYAKCHKERPTFSRICGIYKKEKDIMFIKNTKDIPSLKQGRLSKAIWDLKHMLMKYKK